MTTTILALLVSAALMSSYLSGGADVKPVTCVSSGKVRDHNENSAFSATSEDGSIDLRQVHDLSQLRRIGDRFALTVDGGGRTLANRGGFGSPTMGHGGRGRRCHAAFKVYYY